MKKNTIRYFILALVVMVSTKSQLSAQINDSLKVLCDDIKVVDDDSDPNFSDRYRSGDYSIIIQNDSLIVRIKELTRFKNRDPNKVENIHKSLFKYKASLKEIGSIKLEHRKYGEKYGEGYDESTMKIESLKYYDLFDRIYENGHMNKTYYISFHVINLSDTSKFKKIVSLLNEYIQPENNSIEANCKTDKIHGWSGEAINAIDNNNLEIPIQLNGNIYDEQSIKEILVEYMKEQNIKALLGYGVISENNTLDYLWTEQNILFKFINSNDTLPIGYSMIIDNLGTIDDNQMEELYNRLKLQDWKTGICNNKVINSYFDFIIKNENFKKSEDNKR